MTDSKGDTQSAEPERGRPELVVGIGASAGGITAIKNLLAHTEPFGAAYVVIVHLSPDHDSRLAEVLQTASKLPVQQVTGRIAIQPDHVYVIPPKSNLEFNDSHLSVSAMNTSDQRLAPVDFFFRALGEQKGANAVAVVMSGTGSDGASGLKRVKETGGLAIVQEPDEAEYEDMPRNAIATGLVDYVARADAIPSVIKAYRNRSLQAIDGDAPAQPDMATLRDVLTLLRVRTGHDFSNYKPATLLRRIERRIHVHGLGEARQYVQLLRDRPEEVSLLLNELLISVTNFFRDAEAYDVLEAKGIPRLFESKHATDQVRVWSAGCATGEEAYSLAILLAETATLSTPRVQVFATDLDERAIAVAREGFYTDAEVADVSPERLRRFFIRERTGHRVRREIRELVLFATHNVIKDPPFSHLDLIACRNVLIYLNRTAQERLLETFHFALRPGGLLFLGASETADAGADLFVPVDKGAHLFESRMVSSRVAPALYDMANVVPPRTVPQALELRPTERVSPAELHLRLLESHAPPSVLVTDDYHVLHVSESAARYLEVSPGEPSRDLLKLAVPELRIDLRTALHEASRERNTVRVPNVRVAPEHGDGTVTLAVRPVLHEGDSGRGYLLVFFEEEGREAPTPDKPLHLVSPTDAPVSQLEEELARLRNQLRATIEQYETHVEEAKAANEELQAMNEELRSAAEELETSKEELQSVNEELTTVNQELKLKIDELGLANNDLQNFINSTDIATIFLDRQLRVKLFTMRARDVFNLLPSDVGRPLSDITNVLEHDHLHDDTRTVLERLQTVEREVQTQSGRWYLMRVLPYRTADDRIDGVVVTFVEMREHQQMIR